MSSKRKSKNQYTVHVVSILIVVGMFTFIPLFIIYSDNKGMAAEEVWEHIKALSFIVFSYLYGRNKE